MLPSLFLHILFVCQKGQAVLCGLGVTPKLQFRASAFSLTGSATQTHAISPENTGEENRSRIFPHHYQDTVQFIKYMIGFLRISLQPVHRSCNKVSQKLAEKASEEELLPMLAPEISGSCVEP